MDCLLLEGGLKCDLVTQMTSPVGDTAEQYVGALNFVTRDDQEPAAGSKKDIERFVWEFLANRTALGAPQQAADPASGEMRGCDPYTVPLEKRAVCGRGFVRCWGKSHGWWARRDCEGG